MRNTQGTTATTSTDRTTAPQIPAENAQGQTQAKLQAGTHELMQIADWKGDAEVLKVLLDSGADVNARNSQGYTPLLSAIEAGHAEVAARELCRDVLAPTD